MPSWRGAQLKKERDNFTFTFVRLANASTYTEQNREKHGHKPCLKQDSNPCITVPAVKDHVCLDRIVINHKLKRI
jgi:hypothetical protein